MRNRILAVGEVLFDHFPKAKRLGGAPCNFALHARGLDADAQLLTRVGNDPDGDRIRNRLQAWGFDPMPVQVDPDSPTGAVFVRFNPSGDPEYDIAPAAWDKIELDRELNTWLDDFSPRLVYFGTLVQRTSRGAALIDYLGEKYKGIGMMLCDINLRAGNIVIPRVIHSLRLCDILKLNGDELDLLSNELDAKGSPRQRLLSICHRFDISRAVLTLGDRGSIMADKGRTFSAPALPLQGPLNTVGAGDAFTAVLATGTLNREDPQHILHKASRLATAVCGLPGAVPEHKEFYDHFLRSEN